MAAAGRSQTLTRREEVAELADALYRQRRGYLLTIARANGARRADAEEALQEALCAFIAHYDPKGNPPPLPWLLLALRRECWRRGRLSRREHLRRVADPEAPYEEGGAALEGMAARAEPVDELMVRRETVRRRLSHLKADERTALSLQAAGYSYREIAVMEGWTYTKVCRCIAEGRQALLAVA